MLFKHNATGEVKDWDFSGWLNHIINPENKDNYECNLEQFINNIDKFKGAWEKVETYEDRPVIDLRPEWKRVRAHVDALNKLIDEAILHGGDAGGAYLTNREGLEKAIDNYLEVTGIKPLVDVYWKDEDDPLLVVNDGCCHCPGCIRNYLNATEEEE